MTRSRRAVAAAAAAAAAQVLRVRLAVSTSQSRRRNTGTGFRLERMASDRDAGPAGGSGPARQLVSLLLRRLSPKHRHGGTVTGGDCPAP